MYSFVGIQRAKDLISKKKKHNAETRPITNTESLKLEAKYGNRGQLFQPG